MPQLGLASHIKNLTQNAKCGTPMLTLTISSMRMAGSLGFNGHLRQHFSIYRAISQRVRKIHLHENYPNNPHPHLLQAQ